MAFRVFDAIGRVKEARYGPPIPLDPWHAVGDAVTGLGTAFANSWVNYDGAYPTGRYARFRKFPDGRVMLDGVIKSGVVGSAAFVLPPGYRPDANAAGYFPVVTNNNVFGFIGVDTNGTVYPLVGSNTYFFLSSVAFDTNSVASMPSGSGGLPPVVTVLPPNPVHEQEVFYRFAEGILWHLKYNLFSASAYKWEFVGGPEAVIESMASTSGLGIANSTWADIGSPLIQLTTPLAGDWDCYHGVSLQPSAAATMAIGLAVGATDPNAGNWSAGTMQTVSGRVPLNQTRRLLAVAAATVIKQRYWHNNGAAINLTREGAWMRLRPVRVG